jgi:hypothetical protein
MLANQECNLYSTILSKIFFILYRIDFLDVFLRKKIKRNRNILKESGNVNADAVVHFDIFLRSIHSLCLCAYFT